MNIPETLSKSEVTDRAAIIAAFTELAKVGGAGAIVESCCRSCAMWELPKDVEAADTWAVLVDMDGGSNPKTISADGWFTTDFESLSWGGDVTKIAAALRSQGFWVSVPEDEKRTIGIASLRYKGGALNANLSE